MSADQAKEHLDRGSGEPASGYITTDDVKAVIDQIYADIPSAPAELADLDDVTGTPTTGQSLVWDGTWAPVTTKRVAYYTSGTWPTRPAGLPTGEQVEWRSVLAPDAPPPPTAVTGDTWKRAPGAAY